MCWRCKSRGLAHQCHLAGLEPAASTWFTRRALTCCSNCAANGPQLRRCELHGSSTQGGSPEPAPPRRLCHVQGHPQHPQRHRQESGRPHQAAPTGAMCKWWRQSSATLWHIHGRRAGHRASRRQRPPVWSQRPAHSWQWARHAWSPRRRRAWSLRQGPHRSTRRRPTGQHPAAHLCSGPLAKGTTCPQVATSRGAATGMLLCRRLHLLATPGEVPCVSLPMRVLR